jgi:glycosyltransferase involved in cell wall biosynthesis
VAKRIAFAIPGDLRTPTGGYGYDRRIIAELGRLGWEVEVVQLGEGFPRPSAVQKAVARERLLAAPADRPIVIDGLAFGVLPEAAAALHAGRPVVALVHHPLALETGLTPGEAKLLWDSERAALASTSLVIATSNVTADLLATRFDVPCERIEVIRPGTDRVPLSVGSDGGPLKLISVGAVVARKGFDLLVEALAPLTDLAWQLTIVGDRERDPVAVARLDAVIARHRLGDRVECLGAVPPQRLAALYSQADLFVLASHFEGYGMAYAEAIAHGLPIVGTTGGAIAETVPASAGRLVPPGNVDVLADALREIIGNESCRRTLATGARAAAAGLPLWEDAGARFARALESLA